MNDPKRPRRVDAIEKKLYERDTVSSPDERRDMHARTLDVAHAWDGGAQTNTATLETPIKKGWSFFHYFFVGALVFVLVAAAFLWFSTLRGHSTLSADNIIIDLTAKEFVDGGEDIDLRVHVRNANTVALELVDLVIEYPLSAEATNGEIERIRRPIGTIESNGQIDQPFDIQLFGSEGEERTIMATLEYRIAGSSSPFTKSADTVVGIRSAPLVISINAPERMVSGQAIPLVVTVMSNAQDILDNVAFSIDYPAGFVFAGAQPEPTTGSSVWKLGTLEPGEQADILVAGELAGPLNSAHTFRFRGGQQSPTDPTQLETIFASYAHVVELEDTFLNVDIELNGQTTPTVAYRANGEVSGEITIANTQDQPLSDIRIHAQWVGDLIDHNTVRVTRGRFESGEQTMVWTQDQFGNLGSIAPGDSETVSFSFAIQNPGEAVLNPKSDVFVDIRATGNDGTIYEANSVASRAIALNSHVVVGQETLHSSGPLPNTGPVPPAVGQTTTYTVHWDVHNSSNALADATLTTRLPEHVAWVGSSSPRSERLSYNTETRELVWDIGGVVASAGSAAPAREVWFQVSVTPSSTDAGKAIDLTRDVVLRATDTFTNQELSVNRAGHTTRLMGDVVEDRGLVE